MLKTYPSKTYCTRNARAQDTRTRSGQRRAQHAQRHAQLTQDPCARSQLTMTWHQSHGAFLFSRGPLGPFGPIEPIWTHWAHLGPFIYFGDVGTIHLVGPCWAHSFIWAMLGPFIYLVPVGPIHLFIWSLSGHFIYLGPVGPIPCFGPI